MNFFNSVANLIPEYRDLINHPGTAVSGLSRVHKAHFISALSCEQIEMPLLVLVETENEAVRLCDDINTLGAGVGAETAVVYPAKDINLTITDTQSREYEYRRLSVLANLPKVIISTPEAASQTTFTEKEMTERLIHIRKDEELNATNLLCDLVANGYTRTDLVESNSQFSVRGSVLDIFPVNSLFPVRIDLWGDTVDSLALFEPESQRSIEKISEIKIAPATDSGEGATLFDYVRNIIVCEQTNCDEQLRAAVEQLNEELTLALESGAEVKTKYMLTKSEYGSVVSEKAIAYFSLFGKSKSKQIDTVQVANWNGDYKQLSQDLKSYIRNGYALVLFAGTEKSARGLALDLRDDGFPVDYTENPKKVYAKHIFVTKGTLSGGFNYPQAKCACITLFGNRNSDSGRVNAVQKQGNPKKKNKSEAISALTEMNIGDYIVHDNYGIGIFEGVTKLTSEGVSKDYIKLRYDGKDVLYVPVTQLDFIARYIGNTDSANLKLSKLHTDAWFKARAKAKKAAAELAQELIELYSKRMRSKGHTFANDTHEQEEFENRFSYIETQDQMICIEQLKKDMQSEQPMDRLLCGDVGFGKTEVALRGAFKCIMEGMQCALLCPTTVLAWQHYQTALQRMDSHDEDGKTGLPRVNIELLSRFRTAKEQREVLKNLEAGIVDFVIGTHTLVGKNVRFKSLGLVIIDEEQRFGVTQKERLKESFSGVDVLTLSATPIPRTLNMAMSGIRDMSVIETPPHDRMPVTTYVIEHDMGVIAGAINKELKRAGQIYYIHNRVETIMSCAARLHELVPEARIGIAHGRMEERELLSVWRQLLERQIDLLVCTTLIETGVDVPNVNTLIIENADRMGLAQLHQLRGRVGRTNRRAFAYFTYNRGKVLSEIAEKRLKAVREFTQFGAGFKIALRDLEIRGAGSVLGESQSGHLSAVGYETYVRLLEEAVSEAQAEKRGVGDSDSRYVPVPQCTVDLKADAFIPDGYISNQAQRISCYKKIAEIRDETDSVDIADELTDRYGTIPKPVRGLIDAARLRNMAAALGITEVSQNKEGLFFCWEKPDMERLSKAPKEFAGRIALNLIGKTGVTLALIKGDDVLGVATKFLEGI
ncbi:MAG: transcription-repair coupling factor [Oscillospiraceae bacterium]|nr:transcription-repair coupling factor [Oscillospiraceae bacterium]